jgi:hypothetical protein
MLHHRYRNSLLVSLFLASAGTASAFAPHVSYGKVATKSSDKSNVINHMNFASPIKKLGANVIQTKSFTALQMATDDFQEQKYTESAWACMASLTKAAEYYGTSTVDSPLLLDMLLNPTKHNAGDDAESAKRAVEKVLIKAGVDVNKLRQELDMYMSKQPRMSGNEDQQKTMGRNLVRVLEFSRNAKTLLGVSTLFFGNAINAQHHTFYNSLY